MDIGEILKQLDNVQNLSNAGLTALFCLGMGYLWKVVKLKWCPNEAIPAVVCITGAALFAVLSGHGKTQPDVAWHVRAAVVGFIIGFVVAVLHNFAISKIEDKIMALWGEKPKEPAPTLPTPPAPGT